MAVNVPTLATILEHCRVGPPSDTAEQSLPFSFSDVPWLYFNPTHCLLFYPFPCSKIHFLETIVPNFKTSLSRTLKHFLPLAGNAIVPLDSTIPEFRYVPGDTIPVVVAQANEASDFDYLAGNQPRAADEFYAFFPELPEPKIDSERGFKSVPLFAVQITLFPDTGICVGFNNHHVVGDASSIVRFIKAWSLVSKLAGDDDDGDFLASANMLPTFDRSMIKDPFGLKEIFWNQMKGLKLECSEMRFPVNKVRATFVLKKEDIQKLKNGVQAKNPALVHLSSFTITTAYFWACLTKSSLEIDDDEPEYFAFAVDARQRLDPPAPEAYFGNCLAVAVVETTHGKLRGEEGVVKAAELIGEVIRKKMNDKKEIFRGAELWGEKFGEMNGKRQFGVTGSPRFVLYETDFGWGKPVKYEYVSIDHRGNMSLAMSREMEGGLEIGLSLSARRMEAFAAIFSAGLNV